MVRGHNKNDFKGIVVIEKVKAEVKAEKKGNYWENTDGKDDI